MNEKGGRACETLYIPFVRQHRTESSLTSILQTFVDGDDGENLPCSSATGLPQTRATKSDCPRPAPWRFPLMKMATEPSSLSIVMEMEQSIGEEQRQTMSEIGKSPRLDSTNRPLQRPASASARTGVSKRERKMKGMKRSIISTSASEYSSRQCLIQRGVNEGSGISHERARTLA